MAAMQLRHGSDEVPFLILLNEYRELSFHLVTSLLYPVLF